jgi:hypothetical protein
MTSCVPRFRALLLLLAPLLLLPAEVPARSKNKLVLRVPRTTIPGRRNIELCYFVRIPTTEPFAFGSAVITHKGARGQTQLQHFLTYLYTGERLAEFPADTLVPSRGCLDLGPIDRDDRVLVTQGTGKKVTRTLPNGVAVELAPVPDAPGGPPAGIGILLDVNWVNDDDRDRRVSTRIVFKRAKPDAAQRVARPLFDRSAAAGVFAAPFSEQSTATLVDARWTAPSDQCLLGLSAQMHSRGQCLGADLLDTAGSVKPPAVDFPNPCETDGRRQLYVGLDYTDPGSLSFTTPLLVQAGEALRYSCWLDNGAERTIVRLGCEASPGVTPGTIGSPAPLCSIPIASSAECPGNAACVPANAVAGPSVDDELCGITALGYDAGPGGQCEGF